MKVVLKKEKRKRKRKQHIILIHFLLRKLHPLSKLKLQLTLAYKTKRQQSQRHLLNLKLLLILMNSLISPSQLRVNSMGHQQRFQGLIPSQPVHKLRLQKVRIFLNKILAIMPLFHKRCSENFIQTSL